MNVLLQNIKILSIHAALGALFRRFRTDVLVSTDGANPFHLLLLVFFFLSHRPFEINNYCLYLHL